MRTLPFIFLICAFAGWLSGCGGASYPKEELTKDLEQMVKKEAGEDSKATMVGKTLYLDMELPGLTSQDQAKASAAIKKMNTAVIAITRAALSTDAGIKYMVVSTYDEGKNVVFRMVQDIDDIKGIYYMRISRGDYESRTLLEIEGPPEAAAVLADKHDIDAKEFLGRIIASKINMDARMNPFFGAIISMFHLRYAESADGILFFDVSADMDSKTDEFIKNVIKEETKTYSDKYKIKIDKVEIRNRKTDALTEIEIK